MTVSLHKKSKEKRYRDVSTRSDANLYAPLADELDDEDAIDRLLMNTGFDAENDYESPSRWAPSSEEREESVDFATVAESSMTSKIEPLITPPEEDPAITLSWPDAVQSQPKPLIADEEGTAETTDFADAPEPWTIDDDSAFSLPGASREEYLRIEDLAELEAVPRQNKLSEADLTEISIRSGQSQSSFREEAISAPRDRIASARRSFSVDEKQLLRMLDAKTKKALFLSYVALGIGIGSAVVAAFALTTTLAPKEASELPAHASLPQDAASGLDPKTGNKKTAGNQISFGPLLPVSMPASERAERGQAALNESTFDAGGQSQPFSEIFVSPEIRYTKSGWYVNLLSFRQRSDAEQQALEFMKKGIRTEIIKVEVNQARWYRLRVGGFTRQEQAMAYAEKIKKPLQLDSIWIASS